MQKRSETSKNHAGNGKAVTRWYGQSNWFSLPRAVRYDDRLSHADARVLMAIASFEMKGGEIFPPRWQLEIFTGIAETNISKRTKKLEKLGWLTVIPAPGQVNKYLLHIPAYVLERQVQVSDLVRLETARRAEKKRENQIEWVKNKNGERAKNAEIDERQLDIDYDYDLEDEG